jgi:hypothetical protein
MLGNAGRLRQTAKPSSTPLLTLGFRTQALPVNRAPRPIRAVPASCSIVNSSASKYFTTQRLRRSRTRCLSLEEP